jgi:hypothetical protein
MVGDRVPLWKAIQQAKPEKWEELLKFMRENETDAIKALSGENTGPAMLLERIVSAPNYNSPGDVNRFHVFEKLRNEIVSAFDEKRQHGFVLSGFTRAAPGKRVRISPDLPLEYDFANGIVSSGDLVFHGVTVRPAEAALASPPKHDVSEQELENFCMQFLDDNKSHSKPTPTQDALWKVAKQWFPEKKVTRGRIREIHKKLIPEQERKQGPRK